VSKSSRSGVCFLADGVHPALAAFTIFALAAIAWVPHLGASLLLDETLTFWVIRDGLAETLDRTLHFQPQPAYYLFMWFYTQLAGTSEIALRLPSLVAALAACFAIARLGALLTRDSETGLIAAIVFATTWNVYREAIDARSYMLGLVALLALALSLIRWLERGRMRDAISCGVLAALLPHLHLFFVLCYPALFVYAWVRRAEGNWEAKQFVSIGTILLVGVLLYLPVGQMLAAQGGSYSFVPPPSFRSLFEVFVWAAPVAGLLVGTAISGMAGIKIGRASCRERVWLKV
jgi:4-amino-4-deoxy-L-arabinose transferase-like glycosyltransferase